jgi:hypothetical protein
MSLLGEMSIFKPNENILNAFVKDGRKNLILTAVH